MAKKYTVKGGDSYFSIAGKVLGNQRFFEQILKANGGVDLHPGMVIKIPSVDTEKEPVVSFDAVAFTSLQNQQLSLAGSTNPFATGFGDRFGFDPNDLTPAALRRFNELGVDPFQTPETLRLAGGIQSNISPQFAAALAGADAGGIAGGTGGGAPLTAGQQASAQRSAGLAGLDETAEPTQLPSLTTPGGATIDLTGTPAEAPAGRNPNIAAQSLDFRRQDVGVPATPSGTFFDRGPLPGQITPPASGLGFPAISAPATSQPQTLPQGETGEVSQNIRRPSLEQFRGPGIVQVELRNVLQQIADGSISENGPELAELKNELVALGIVSPDSSPFAPTGFSLFGVDTSFGSDRYNFQFLSAREARVYSAPRRPSRRISGSGSQSGPTYSSGAVSRAIRWRIGFG